MSRYPQLYVRNEMNNFLVFFLNIYIFSFSLLYVYAHLTYIAVFDDLKIKQKHPHTYTYTFEIFFVFFCLSRLFQIYIQLHVVSMKWKEKTKEKNVCFT